MSKADYPYPDDEFDTATDPDVPRGVHRAPRTTWGRWWPFLAVLVLAPLLAFGAVTVWGLVHDGSVSTSPGSTDDGSQGGTDDETTDEGTGEESPTPGDEQSPSPSDEQTTPAPTPTPVLSTPIQVLNGASIAGLAGRQVTKLTGAGFTAVAAGNVTGTPPTTSTVFYATADLQPTANLVAQTLGLTTTELSATQAGSGISVVLLEDPDA